MFRALWFAALASNIGTMMHGVAAAWLMTSLTTSPIPIALLTTMASLPLFLMSLPAGALADVIDRRWLILGTQVWTLVVAAILAALVALGWMTPWLLLALTFVLGVGGALSAPAWQAVIPDLVPRHELPSAVALNGAGFNLARAVGPALGGLLVAAAGPAAVFMLNAASFIGVIAVMYRWKPEQHENTAPKERVSSAITAAVRFARHSPPLRAVLVRTAAFIFAASALWALLPVVADQELGLDALGYGILLGSIGLGAVGGATAMPWLRERLSIDQLTFVLTLVFAGGTIALALIQNLIVLNILLMAVGVSWLIVTSNLNVAAQTTAPAWVQARALGIYLLVFQGGFAVGSALWGLIADWTGTSTTLLCAAGVMVVGLATALRWRLLTGEDMDLTPSQHWPEPELAIQPALDDGPVLITVEYRVAEAQRAAFCEAMADVQTIRLRDGASRWDLFRDTAMPDRYLETFVVASWAEHLRQHERVTVTDQEVEQRAAALQRPGTQPVVSHFIASSCVPHSLMRGQ